MKLHKVALGVAALTAIASPAFALTASTYNPANAMEIYVSGATAMDVGLENATLAMCQAGTIHKYTVSNQAVWLCTPRTTGANAIGNLQGRTQLAVHKHSVGGSGNGVAPVNNSTPLPFLDLVKIASSCAAATGAATTIACTEASTTLTTTQVAPLGISDIEPQFFGAATGTYNNLIIEPLATVIFGLPVSTAAYTALQAAQGLTVGATDAANIPSLSSAQITSLFTQEGQSWSAVTGATLADDTVYVARRADSSGTQKTYEAVIARTLNTTAAGKSCNAGLPTFLSGVDAIDNNAANNLCNGDNLIVNNSGSGQVAACLNRFNTAGKGAIGTLTTEAVSTNGWKHVRVNGLLGNYANVKSGAYKEYGDAALNTRRSPGIDADHAAYKTAFKALFAAVPVLHPAFGDTNTDAGKGGVIGLNKVTGQTTGNPWNRTDDSGIIDNCRPARADF
ncbi:hypothetical protein IP87_00360 [beta proteobacterium AAP121]|nr:hypothetical protein IP80_13195 [beta proteobacterium AAP65]KPG01119.1 hypothetical protein IP87_00360 [beta proteobacterium AAP121]